MAIRTHYFCIAVGEELGNPPSRPTPVDLSLETTLYSGRVCHLDSDGKAREGLTGPGVPAFFVRRGVECADVKGAAAILSGETGSLVADASGNGMVEAVLCQPGLVVITTEYDWTGSPSVGDAVKVNTGDGKLIAATGVTNNETIGYVLAEGSDVNAAYASDRDLIEVQLTRSGISL